MEFEKQDSHHESRALVAIDKRMVAHDAACIGGGHVDNSRRLGEVLLRSGQR